MLLNTPALQDEQVVLISTKRYLFWKLLRSIPNNLARIELVDDYADSRRLELAQTIRPYDPKAILIQSGEFIVPMVNFLNRAFDLKGNSDYSSEVSLNKSKMRELFVEAGVPTVKYVELNSADQLDEVDFFPCVVKPTVSTGAAGIRKVDSPADLEAMLSDGQAAARKTEFESNYIAEEYITGRQFDVEGLIVDGEPEILCFVEEYYEASFPRFEHSWFLFNPEIGERAELHMAKQVAVALQAAGLEHGSFHCELRVTPEGECKVIEFSNRMGGGFESMIKQVTGNDIVDLYAASMLGKPLQIQPNRRSHLMQRYCLTTTEIDRWEAYARQAGAGFSANRRPYREFAGHITFTTDDWTVMAKAKLDLLGVADEPLPL